jgi:hypothetical protein
LQVDEKIKLMLMNSDILEEYKYNFNKDDVVRRWHVFSLPQKMTVEIEKQELRLDQDEEKFQGMHVRHGQDVYGGCKTVGMAGSMLAEQEVFDQEVRQLDQQVSANGHKYAKRESIGTSFHASTPYTYNIQ